MASIDLNIHFTDDEHELIDQSPWLKKVAERKARALSGDTEALEDISRGGDGREEILAIHDHGQWTANHIREGRQEETSPIRGLTHALNNATQGHYPEHFINVDARQNQQSLVRAIRLLVVAALEKELGRKAIVKGLLDEDSVNRESLEARTQYDDGGATAQRRADEAEDVEMDLLGQYLTLEEMENEGESVTFEDHEDFGGLDPYIARVAAEKELELLEQLAGAYNRYRNHREDPTQKMLDKMNQVTIPALERLRIQVRNKLGEEVEEVLTSAPKMTVQKPKRTAPPKSDKKPKENSDNLPAKKKPWYLPRFIWNWLNK